jgi:hypothetical protein
LEPVRELQKHRNRDFFCLRSLHELQSAVGTEPFMELSDPERASGGPAPASPTRASRAAREASKHAVVYARRS